MKWDWVIAQLAGEPLPIPKGGGRLVINIGMSGRSTKPLRTEIRTLIVEMLVEAGEMSTQELYDGIEAESLGLTREGFYSICKKMRMKGQLETRTVPRPDGFGKGISLWRLK